MYDADDYGIDTNKIAVIGFSAGGIANGHSVLDFGGNINGTVLDKHYETDEIDEISSTPNAVIMGYSFYGVLSVANLQEETFKDRNLPPTYYVYGTEDPFYNQFHAQINLLKSLNKEIEYQVLEHYPHGFGIEGNWADDVDKWLSEKLV